MDRMARLMHYAEQNFGNSPQTTQRVLDAIRNGTEASLLTRNQRRRDRQKLHTPISRGTRKRQRIAGVRGALVIADELATA